MLADRMLFPGPRLSAGCTLQAAHAETMARELLANGGAVTSLLGMLTSWEEPVRLAAVRALAKVCWQVRGEKHVGVNTQNMTL